MLSAHVQTTAAQVLTSLKKFFSENWETNNDCFERPLLVLSGR